MAKVGRPTVYYPEICDEVIEFMAKGYSFDAFAGHVDISKEPLYQWIKKYPEFSDSKRRAFQLCREFWETKGIEGLFSTSRTEKSGDTLISESKALNASVWIFNMRNRFKWTDMRTKDGPDGEPLDPDDDSDDQPVRGITKEEAIKLLEERRSKKVTT